jgi:hypothetical protein
MTGDRGASLSARYRAKIEATTEDDIRRQVIEDGENPDEEMSKKQFLFGISGRD